MYSDKNKNKKGFSLVEVIIFSLIVVIVILTFYRTFTSGSAVLRDARARIAAAQVANEEIETLRNISYDDLKTTEEGVILASKEVTRSSIKFNVDTSITYIDDPYDHTVEDAIPDTKSSDYKNIQIVVSWKVAGASKSIKMFSHIAPPGTEELYTGGILDIKIIRSDDVTPVEGAKVVVRKASNNEFVGQYTTGSDGRAYFPGYDPGDNLYRVTVTKDNYYSVTTMPLKNGTTQLFDPKDLDASVALSGISHKTISFDPLASLQLKTVDPVGSSIANIDFTLEGGRELGSDGTINYYSFPKTNENTNSLGIFEFTDKSAGRYFFQYLDTPNNANYVFWKTAPLDDATTNNNFNAVAGVTTDATAILVPKDASGLFLRTVVEEPSSPPNPPSFTALSEAKVKVSNESLSYSEEQLTDKFGKVYFHAPQAGTYKVEIILDGYHQKDSEINIDVNNLVDQDLLLEQN